MARPLTFMRTPAMLRITDTVAIEDWELSETFHRASGPGGQNVNKVSTAVALRFEAARSPSLPEGVRIRLERLAGRRLTDDGVLVIRAERHRTQERNREDARARLAELVREALYVPKTRVKTKPSRASIERRRSPPAVPRSSSSIHASRSPTWTPMATSTSSRVRSRDPSTASRTWGIVRGRSSRRDASSRGAAAT